MASFSPLAGGPRSESAEAFLLPNPGSSHVLLCSFLPPAFFSELGFQPAMALPALRVTFMLRPPRCLGISCQSLIHANSGSPPSLDPSLCSYGSMRPTHMDTGLDLGAVQPSGKLVAIGRSLTAEGHGDREQLLSIQPALPWCRLFLALCWGAWEPRRRVRPFPCSPSEERTDEETGPLRPASA